MSHHVLPPFLRGRDAAAGFEGFWLTNAHNSGVEAHGQPYTDAELSNLVAGLERSGPEVHEVSWAEGALEVLVYDLALALGRCSESSKIIAQMRSVARCVARPREWTRVLSGEQSDWSNGFSQECSACLSATGLFSGPTYPFAVTPASRGACGPFVTVVGSASWSEVASSAVCDPSGHDVVALWERMEFRSTWTSPIRTTRSVLSFPASRRRTFPKCPPHSWTHWRLDSSGRFTKKEKPILLEAPDLVCALKWEVNGFHHVGQHQTHVRLRLSGWVHSPHQVDSIRVKFL